MGDSILPQSKICTKCGLDKPLSEYHKHTLGKYGLNPRCKSCKSDEALAARLADPEKYKKWSLDWYYANKEHVATRVSSWQRENKEIVNAKSKRWRDKNRAKIVEYNRGYKANHKEELAASTKKWRQENPETVRSNKRNRKARIKNAPGRHTAMQTLELMEKQQYRCANCEIELTRANRHLDHWHPLALGGSNGIENLQWLCQTCNQSKNDLDPIEWLRRIGKACHWPLKFKQEPLVAHVARLEVEALCE